MGLLSFLKRNRADDTSSAPTKASRAARATAASPDDVQRARTRARQRLIGAVVLLGIGVIAFPIVFETQPRPIPVDLPIEIPRKETMAPLPAPRPRAAAAPSHESAAASAPVVIDERSAEAGKEVPPPVSAAAKPLPESVRPSARAAAEPTREPAPPPATAAVPESSRAQALLDDKPAAVKAGDAARFVVQVGAFAEAGAARETRLKVEKLGLKTYTQVVETETGKRIRVRVGPFASRDDADKAAGRIKSAGLPSAVLGL